MKLENLKVNISLKANNNNDEVLLNFELGSYEISDEEHKQECELIEKMLPALNGILNGVVEDMTKKKK